MRLYGKTTADVRPFTPGTPSENKKEIRRDSSVSRILSPTRLDGRSVPTEAAASQEIGPRPVGLWRGRRRPFRAGRRKYVTEGVGGG